MDSQVNGLISETKRHQETKQTNQQTISDQQAQIPGWQELFQLLNETAAECKLLAKALYLVKENMQEAKKPEWLNSAEVMQMLRISKRTLQNYRNSGSITFKKLKGKIYYRRSELMALIKP